MIVDKMQENYGHLHMYMLTADGTVLVIVLTFSVIYKAL